MNRNTIGVIVAIVIAFVISFSLATSKQEARESVKTEVETKQMLRNITPEQVYSVCQESRISDTIPEEYCAYAQDENGVEYICEQANKDPNNNCYIEVK